MNDIYLSTVHKYVFRWWVIVEQYYNYKYLDDCYQSLKVTAL